MRPRQHCCGVDRCCERYAGVALFVDEGSVAAAITPNPYNPGKSDFDMIDFQTGESLTGREFKLDWTLPKDANGRTQAAQVQFLEIEFSKVISTLTLTCLVAFLPLVPVVHKSADQR